MQIGCGVSNVQYTMLSVQGVRVCHSNATRLTWKLAPRVKQQHAVLQRYEFPLHR